MFFLKRNFKKIIFIVFLLIVLVYVVNITSIPDSIVLFQGESLELGTIFGVLINDVSDNYETVEASSLIESSNKIEKKNVTISLFNLVDVKNVEVNTIPKTSVIPLGNSVGLKLYTRGVLVVGMTEIEGKKPYENSGIEEGDMIVEINQEEITCTSELISSVNNSNGEKLNVKYLRDGEEYIATMAPTKTKDNEYKLGLWVRDGAAGIGIISYYEPQSGDFAALGHGIIDIDTEELINISSGELVTSKISSIVKGEEGIPRRNKR